MKRIFLLISFIILSIGCKKANAQKENTSKQIKKIEYIDKETQLVSMTEFFDKQGNKIEIITHSEKYGDSKNSYKYDTKNQLIEEKEFGVKGQLTKTNYYEYTYIKDRIQLKLTYEKRAGNEKQLKIEESFKYNSDGLLINKKRRSVFGNSESNFIYHKNGKIKEEIILAYKDTEKVVISYNNVGNRIEENIFRRKTTNDLFKLELTNNWYYDTNGSELTKEGQLIKENSPFTKKYYYFD